MKWFRFAAFLSLASAAAVAISAPARADKERAKELFKKGMTQYKLDQFDLAIDSFAAAYAEEPSPVFLFNIAQAHRLAKHPRPAIEFYRKYLKDAPEAKNRAAVEEQIAGLEREAKLQDAQAQERAARQKEAEEAARREREQREAQEAALSAPPVEEKPAKKRWPLWVAIGAGAAVVVGAAVTTGVVLGTRSPSEPTLGLESAR